MLASKPSRFEVLDKSPVLHGFQVLIQQVVGTVRRRNLLTPCWDQWLIGSAAAATRHPIALGNLGDGSDTNPSSTPTIHRVLCIRVSASAWEMETHARLMMDAKPGRRSVVRARRHWAGREAAGFAEDPEVRSLRVPIDDDRGRVPLGFAFFVWRPTAATRRSSPREMKKKKKSPADQLVGDEVQQPRMIRHAISSSRSTGLVLVPSPVSHSCSVVLRRAVRHPPKSTKFPRRKNGSLRSAPAPFAYYLQCPQQKKPTFSWVRFPTVYSCRRRATAVESPAGPPRRRASGDPALVSQVAEVIGDCKSGRAFVPAQQASCALPIGMLCAIRLSMNWSGAYRIVPCLESDGCRRCSAHDSRRAHRPLVGVLHGTAREFAAAVGGHRTTTRWMPPAGRPCKCSRARWVCSRVLTPG